MLTTRALPYRHTVTVTIGYAERPRLHHARTHGFTRRRGGRHRSRKTAVERPRAPFSP